MSYSFLLLSYIVTECFVFLCTWYCHFMQHSNVFQFHSGRSSRFCGTQYEL